MMYHTNTKDMATPKPIRNCFFGRFLIHTVYQPTWDIQFKVYGLRIVQRKQVNQDA